MIKFTRYVLSRSIPLVKGIGHTNTICLQVGLKSFICSYFGHLVFSPIDLKLVWYRV